MEKTAGSTKLTKTFQTSSTYNFLKNKFKVELHVHFWKLGTDQKKGVLFQATNSRLHGKFVATDQINVGSIISNVGTDLFARFFLSG